MFIKIWIQERMSPFTDMKKKKKRTEETLK